MYRALPPLLATLFVMLLVVPRLPPGACFDDSGDLQTAAATLGIAHPPGYPLYTLLGHVFIRLTPWWSPAYAITLLCCAAMLGALLLCGLAQIRMGVRPWLAAAVLLLLAAHPSVICALLAPEVYAPTLALLGGAVVLLLPRPAGSRRRAYAAVLLLSVAMVSRPPLMLAAPAFLPAVRGALKWRELDRAARRRTIGFVLAAAAAPPAVAVAYVALRDAASNPYNYIERYRNGTAWLPPIDASLRDRAVRAVWLLSGRQHAAALLSDPRLLPTRLASVARDALPLSPWLAAPLVGLALLGWIGLARRNPPTACMTGGLAGAALVWLVLFDVPGTAADCLPLLWPLAVATGYGVSTLLEYAPPTPAGRAAARGLPPALAAAAAALAGWTLGAPQAIVHDVDATPWLARLDLDRFPANSVILSAWRESTPLWYAQTVDHAGATVRVVNAPPESWPTLTAGLEREPDTADSRIFVVREIAPPPPLELAEFRCIWEWVGPATKP